MFLLNRMDVYMPFIPKRGIVKTITFLEVKGLFATLTVELQATVVK
jgi:2-iminobutanoate/2-iminopropanoate deaminase